MMWEHRGVKDELCYKNSYKSSQKKKKHLSWKERGRRMAGINKTKETRCG